ncbi:GAF domain-containing sensor histidine kinase [Arthrobacter sp. Br18]|uniref:GAF domain-containing sensor histidine kinase n=1 Tax=Arthrobacter sp. Br18 TaxID=1312954 RepID=UPI0004BC7E83|nr:GAF domain-containing sensor histidine kinase [Arthrobacter sp. Br18]
MSAHPEQQPPQASAQPLSSFVHSGIDDLLSGFAAIAENRGLEKVLERVVSAACQLLGANFAALGVIGPDKHLNHFITVGLQDDEIRRIGTLPVGHGVLGLLISEPVPLRLADLSKHPSASGFPAHHPPMTSFLGVPIRVRDTIFGNLYLTEKSDGTDFSEADEELAVALAAAAGVAIENMRLFEDESRRSRWLESGQGAVRALLDDSQGSLSDVELVAAHARSASRAALVLILTRLTSDEPLYCEVALGLHGNELQGRQSGSGPALQDLTSRSRGTTVLRGEQLLHAVPLPEADAFDAALCTRLASRGSQARFLVVARTPDGPPFSRVDEDMATAFASHVSLALELIQIQLQREQDAVFGDRDRIARDLHDLVIQRLFAAGLSIQSLRRYLSDDEPLARITAVTTELDATIRELRDTIYSLQSVAHSRPSVSSRILGVVQQAFEGCDMEPVIQFSGPVDTAIGDLTADHVRAIVHEGLSNAIRHSRARTVTISLRVAGNEVELRIKDDGRGFQETGRRSGLRNMQHRAELCGGHFHLDTVIGRGTGIVVTLPLVS